jgi:prefoldin subunit 5
MLNEQVETLQTAHSTLAESKNEQQSHLEATLTKLESAKSSLQK